MQESIKKRIEAVRRGAVPEGYNTDRAMLFPKEWGEPVALNTVLLENKDRNEDLRFGKDDVLSVSGERGIVNQIDLLGRSYAGESVAPYHIVETSDVVYTKSPLKQNPYGIIKQNRGKPGIVSTLYAVYHCNSPITGQYLENYFCIDTFLNNYLKPLVKRGAKNDMKVNNEEVLLGRIPMPPIEEQRKINSLIAQFDRIIDLKQKLIEEKRRQKQWLMQKLLDPNSGVRLPGFENSIWKKIVIGEECEMFSGGTPKAGKDEYYIEGTIPFIRSGEIAGDKTELFLTDAGYNRSSAKMVQVGDILYALYGANSGECSISKINGAINQAILCVRPKCIERKMLYYLLYANKQRIVATYLQGGQGNLSADIIKKLVVELPEDKEHQRKIVEIIQAADNDITCYEAELKAWQKKKKALMQLLLTGLVRVNA